MNWAVTATDSGGVSHTTFALQGGMQNNMVFMSLYGLLVNINISGNKKNINKIDEIRIKQKDIAMPIHFFFQIKISCVHLLGDMSKDTADSADIGILFGSN